MDFLGKFMGSGRKKDRKPVFEDKDWERRWPCLYQLMTVEEFKGKPRMPASVTLFLADSMLKACVNEKEMGLVGFLSASSFEGLWDGLEASLADDSLDWREDKLKRKRG